MKVLVAREESQRVCTAFRPKEERAKLRSQTFPGIAKAMFSDRDTSMLDFVADDYEIEDYSVGDNPIEIKEIEL